MSGTSKAWPSLREMHDIAVGKGLKFDVKKQTGVVYIESPGKTLDLILFGPHVDKPSAIRHAFNYLQVTRALEEPSQAKSQPQVSAPEKRPALEA